MLSTDDDLVGDRQDVVERGLADAEHRGGARFGATTGTHDTTVDHDAERAQGANGPVPDSQCVDSCIAIWSLDSSAEFTPGNFLR
jgi:hypothetical protein